MQKKKVLFVATVVKTHIMEFHIPYLAMFQDMGWETAVAAKNDYEDPADCRIPHCDTYYDIPFARLPWKTDNLKAYRQLKKIIDEINRLRGEGVLEPMIAEVFPDNEEARVELLARVAMALKTENFQFLYGNYGKLREKELQERLVKCGVVGYVYLNAQR